MGCPSEVEIGSDLVFSICTHNPETGALTWADADPIYRVYEDETQDPILTGTMSALDGANTTGFYVKKITCSSTNGFENDKTYSVYISATVNTFTGGICYGFKAYTQKTQLGTGAITWTYTLTESSTGYPISDADVWITTDIAGSNVIASGKTNIHGVVTFYLDAGIIYVWRQKAGYNFDNPDVEDTSIDSTPGEGTDTVPKITWTYTLTESVSGDPIPGATIRLSSDIGGAITVDTQTTNASGVATFSLDAGTYYAWRTCIGYTFEDPDVEVVA